MSREDETPARRRGAGLFDLRLIIAVLFAVYGVVLTIMGIAGASEEDLRKSGGIHINLWVGISMLVFAALFAVWTFVRPAVVAEPETEEEDRPPVH